MKTIHFDSIDSTNAFLKEHFEDLEDHTFVSASHQSKGKGREDRSWIDSAGDNLLFSVLLKRPTSPLGLGPFVLSSAVAVASVLEEEGILGVSIKWPNDVYVNGKKIAGILLEGRLPEYLAIGIGINVNQTSFPIGLRVCPTSLALEVGHKVDLKAFKAKIYAKMESFLNDSQEITPLLKFFRCHDHLQGKRISVNGKEGICTGVNERFCLLLDGEEIVSGEVKVLG